MSQNAKGCFAVAFILTVESLACFCRADVTMPPVFSDHMALQADMAVPVWGSAEPGELVTVKVGGQNKTGKADAKGAWRVTLDKLAAGLNTEMIIEGKNRLRIQDVLVGEVWLCAGQSNMGIKASGVLRIDSAESHYPQLRMFVEKSVPGRRVQLTDKPEWLVCSPENTDHFSATAYHFGRYLHKKLGKPVGLVVAAVGGSPIGAWISGEAQNRLPETAKLLEDYERTVREFTPAKAKAFWNSAAKAGRNPPPIEEFTKGINPRNYYFGYLFDARIKPLIGYAIRGAIWYQGEGNAHRVEQGKLYAKQLPLLIEDWRQRWGQGRFPFAWVQLPNFGEQKMLGWCYVRESMLQSLKVPNTGMAIILDLGETKSIHPLNKQGVGERLGLWALAKVYGQKIAYSGALPKSHSIQGDKVVVTFTHAEGLHAKGGGLVEGFSIAGQDQKWHPAEAVIEGDRVIVSSPEVKVPAAVRYAWSNDPVFNLYNAAMIPASPFRTDTW